MSASIRTVQQTLGTSQLGAALAAVALAIVLAAALAFSQSAATTSQTTPAAGTAPVFVDHGSRDEMVWPGAVIGVDRAYNDYGSKGSAPARLDFGSDGPGVRPQ